VEGEIIRGKRDKNYGWRWKLPCPCSAVNRTALATVGPTDLEADVDEGLAA
jgi:hypothetical protein